MSGQLREWRLAYERMWLGLLFSRLVQQCTVCDRAVLLSKRESVKGWMWTFQRGRVVWTCAECSRQAKGEHYGNVQSSQL